MAGRRSKYISATSEYTAARHAARLQYWREYNRLRKFGGRPSRRFFRLGKQAHVSRPPSRFTNAVSTRNKLIAGHQRIRVRRSTFDNMRQSLVMKRVHLSLRSAASLHLASVRSRQQLARNKRKGL